MSEKTVSKPPIRERVRHELREYAEVSVYLFVCFAALFFYRYALLEEHGVSGWRAGMAVGKALVLGKFILIGKALRVGERREQRTLVAGVVVKSLLFLLVLIALSIVEEMIVSLVHHRPFTAGLAERGTPLQLVASSVVMLLILVPYFAFQELEEAMGAGSLRRVFLQKRQ